MLAMSDMSAYRQLTPEQGAEALQPKVVSGGGGEFPGGKPVLLLRLPFPFKQKENFYFLNFLLLEDAQRPQKGSQNRGKGHKKGANRPQKGS
jgi:hypothetical protein